MSPKPSKSPLRPNPSDGQSDKQPQDHPTPPESSEQDPPSSAAVVKEEQGEEDEKGLEEGETADRVKEASVESGQLPQQDEQSAPNPESAITTSSTTSSSSPSSSSPPSSATPNGKKDKKSKAKKPSRKTKSSSPKESDAIVPKADDPEDEQAEEGEIVQDENPPKALAHPLPKLEEEGEDAHEAEEEGEVPEEGAIDEGTGSGSSASAEVNRSSSSRRQRSISHNNKEIAQLGLASIGDGEDEPLAPRRSRRALAGSPVPKGRGDKSGSVEAEERESNQVREEEMAQDDQDAYDDLSAAPADEYNDGETGDEGVTRCVCGSMDENVGLMIQCETCKCWQHCVCMGMQVEEDCPDVYFCEQCKPELHIPLLRSFGLLPPPRAHKKGAGKSQKNSARELKEAKEAIAAMTAVNAQRRKEAVELIAGHAANSRERRQNSSGRSESRDVESRAAPKSPKRRSTMNSRESAYGGWETIPPGLLAEGEVWEGAQVGGEGQGQDPHAEVERRDKSLKKRKRGSHDEVEESNDNDDSPDRGDDGTGPAEVAKRRRMSTSQTHPGAPKASGDEDTSHERSARDGESPSAQGRDKGKKKKSSASGANAAHGSSREASLVSAHQSASNPKPKHPNQYTYRNKEKTGSKDLARGSGQASTSTLTSNSPSPSPSKSRAEASRRGNRDLAGSRTSTPAPGDTNGGGRSHNPGAPWGLPDHLAHLAYLLPMQAKPSHGGGLPSTSNKGSTPSSNPRRTALAASASSPVITGLPMPTSPNAPQPFRVMSAIEPTTKVRFPARRMTMGEMRKRVRNIGEYVTRTQIEAVDREKRMRLLGIVPPHQEEALRQSQALSQGSYGRSSARPSGSSTPQVDKPKGEPATDREEDVEMADVATEREAKTSSYSQGDQKEGEGELVGADALGDEVKDAKGGAPDEGQPEGERNPFESLPISMRLIEELTRELINFQRKFGVGPGSGGGFASGGQAAAQAT
ncbi:hypothetical protein IE53DRAFT_396115 [Violaceomyces palustris]|uniref:Uncharacterized protein n=1 Tax=Violaceomyces palustris TaxID=1673888 RepID=A0ACD0NWH2_9BASI|nr:hypothetical protein IE53DRAFT_396115 [Violaceomyces palustris]